MNSFSFWLAQKGVRDTKSPHSHLTYRQPIPTLHLSRYHQQPHCLPLSWPNPNTQQGHLQDIYHCLRIGVWLTEWWKIEIRNFPRLTPSFCPSWWPGGRFGLLWPQGKGGCKGWGEAPSHVSALYLLSKSPRSKGTGSSDPQQPHGHRPSLFPESKTGTVAAGEEEDQGLVAAETSP